MSFTIKDNNSKPTSVLYDADKETMAVSLPEDVILFQIITRVPAKSVIRFKCVSKQWKSFLMSDRFKQMHSRSLLKGPHLEDHNLLSVFDYRQALVTINCESLPNKAPRWYSLPQSEGTTKYHISILTSYHGLVCLRITTYDYQDKYIILWNPLTTEFKRLSKPSNPDHMECYKHYGKGYGLYYSSCEDDYKLLVVSCHHNIYIYSLKSDSWRKLNKKPPCQEEGFSWRPGFCFSENIYFLGPNQLARFSIRFDTRAERFHKIQTPPDEYDTTNYPHCTGTSVHRGSIHLCVSYNIYGRTDSWESKCIELWKFKADGDIWVKVETYQLMPNDDIRGGLYPLHLMSNGKWLMRNHRGRICQVDLKKKKYIKNIEDHKCKGKNNSKGNCYDEYKLLYYSKFKYINPEEVRYTETFVSPNQYIK